MLPIIHYMIITSHMMRLSSELVADPDLIRVKFRGGSEVGGGPTWVLAPRCN